jgi:hypothetical protein
LYRRTDIGLGGLALHRDRRRAGRPQTKRGSIGGALVGAGGIGNAQTSSGGCLVLALLHRVSEFVPQQLPARHAARRIAVAAKDDVSPHSECFGGDRLRRRRGAVIGMNTDATEVVAEPGSEEGAFFRRERRPRCRENLVHHWRCELAGRLRAVRALLAGERHRVPFLLADSAFALQDCGSVHRALRRRCCKPPEVPR